MFTPKYNFIFAFTFITPPAPRAWRSLKFASNFFFQCRKLGYRLWVIPLCILLSEPVSSRLLNSISTKLFHQNKQFNAYTTTSKQQEGSTSKNLYPKCFITTNFDKFHREERQIAPLIFRCVSISTCGHRSNL